MLDGIAGEDLLSCCYLTAPRPVLTDMCVWLWGAESTGLGRAAHSRNPSGLA